MDFAETSPRRRCRPLPEHLRGRGDVDQTTIDGWCAEYARTHDPELKERIVAAHQWLVRDCCVAPAAPQRAARRPRAGRQHRLAEGARPLRPCVPGCVPDLRVGDDRRRAASSLPHRVDGPRPVWMQERHLAVRGAFGRLESSIGRTPTMGEVAAMLGLTVPETIEAFALGAQNWVESLSGLDGATDGVARSGATDETAAADDRVVTAVDPPAAAGAGAHGAGPHPLRRADPGGDRRPAGDVPGAGVADAAPLARSAARRARRGRLTPGAHAAATCAPPVRAA